MKFFYFHCSFQPH